MCIGIIYLCEYSHISIQGIYNLIKTDMLYDIEDYPVMACISTYVDVFRVIFSLIEAMSGEWYNINNLNGFYS